MDKMKFTALLAIFFLTFMGCIKENLDDCEGPVTLLFRYAGDGTQDIFPEKIDKVNMYVYSLSDNSYVGEYTFSKSELEKFQGARFKLKPGEYKVVCWGNIFDKTAVDARGENPRVAEPAHFDGGTFGGNDAIYFGTVELNVPETLAAIEERCDFSSAHVRVQVKLENFKGAIIPGISGTASEFSLIHTNISAYTDFKKQVSKPEETCHVAFGTDTEDENSFITTYNLMRFDENTSSTITINTNEGREVITFSLADFIREHDLKFSNRNEAVISILIRAKGSQIDIVDWEVEEVYPGFDKD